MPLHATYSVSRPDVDPTIFTYGLRIEVTHRPPEEGDEPETALKDPAIFVFQQGVPGPSNPARDKFVHVATPLDMDEIPASEPDIPSGEPYYRLSEVTLWFRSLSDLYDTRNTIDLDIRGLVRSWNQLHAAFGIVMEEDYE